MTTKTAAPVSMWAIVIRNPRPEWIYYPSISRLRSDAWKKYAEGWKPEFVKRNRRNGTIRAARVVVSIA